APQLGDPCAVRLAPPRPSGHGTEDPRLPPAARGLPLRRGARRGAGDRAGPSAGPQAPRRPVSGIGPPSRGIPAAVLERVPAPHLLAGAMCLGLAAALAAPAPRRAAAIGALVLAVLAVVAGPRRAAALVGALFLAGWWWGSNRLELLDRSALTARAGSSAPVRLMVIGPPRRGRYSLHVPVRVLRIDGLAVDEPARLELPPQRAPPQGALIVTPAIIALPPAGDGAGGFDEATYLRRQGIHVVLRASSFSTVGRRGGIGGLGDSLRRSVAASLAGGLTGERRALVEAIVLGDVAGLPKGLQDDLRISGLYHLLAVSGQNVLYVVAGMLLLAWLAGLPRWAGHLGALLGIAAYVLAVGWQPSIVRAGVAGALACLAWLASRPTDR